MLPWISQVDQERFWSKVDKEGPKINGLSNCWIWIAGRSTGKLSKPYGAFGLNGKTERAHRVSWLIHFGAPVPKVVCHKCDVYPCVNPKHLFVGSYLLNSQDMVSKGRHWNTKLSTNQVLSLRKDYVNGFSTKELSEKYSITQDHCMIIIRRKLGQVFNAYLQSKTDVLRSCPF